MDSAVESAASTSVGCRMKKVRTREGGLYLRLISNEVNPFVNPHVVRTTRPYHTKPPSSGRLLGRSSGLAWGDVCNEIRAT